MLTLDSSVIVAALRKQEPNHEACKQLLEQIKDDVHIAVEPLSVLVEVTAAIRRRTNSQELANKVRQALIDLDTIHFLELGSKRAEEAALLAMQTGVRGMDAIVAQVAKEFDATLITLDQEMLDRLQDHISVKSVEEFQSST